MDENLLKKLKPGEKLVEMQEYKYGRITAIDVTVYTCKHKGLFSKKIVKYTPPFFFVSKEFAEEFLKHWDEFDIEIGFGGKIFMYLYKNPINKYCMVNEYISNTTDDVLRRDRGVWGGRLFTSGYVGGKFYYTDIYAKDLIPIETDKHYVFKMIEEK